MEGVSCLDFLNGFRIEDNRAPIQPRPLDRQIRAAKERTESPATISESEHHMTTR